MPSRKGRKCSKKAEITQKELSTSKVNVDRLSDENSKLAVEINTMKKDADALREEVKDMKQKKDYAINNAKAWSNRYKTAKADWNKEKEDSEKLELSKKNSVGSSTRCAF
jgi:hypothetical protein